MRLQLVRHLWGVDLQPGLDCYLARWQRTGYTALEVAPRFVPDQPAFLGFLKRNGMDWIPPAYSQCVALSSMAVRRPAAEPECQL